MNICPNCGCENKDSNKFCDQCGTELVNEIKFCPECGAELKNNPRFCPQCGHMNYGEKQKKNDIAKPEDKKSKIQKILKDYYYITKTEYGNYVPFEELGDRKKNLLKFDGNLDFDAVIGLFDTSVSLSFKEIWDGSIQTPCKEGLLFTLSGVYERWGPLSGSQYIRYSDIRTMTVENKKDGALIINNGQYRIGATCFYVGDLKELLEKICEINNRETSFTEVINSGKRKGILSAATRQYGYERELLAYQRCSREYEIKLRRQADLFLQTTNAWKKKLNEYEALLDEYEKTIQELEEAVSQTNSPEYRARLENVCEYRDRLASLKD